MAHTINNKAKLLTRIRRIRGQTEGLEKAVSAEGDCTAILQQIAAIRGAVNGLMAEVLEGHLREHNYAKICLPQLPQTRLSVLAIWMTLCQFCGLISSDRFTAGNLASFISAPSLMRAYGQIKSMTDPGPKQPNTALFKSAHKSPKILKAPL